MFYPGNYTFINYTLFNYTLIIFYQMIIEKIRTTEPGYQPFVALALPILREFNVWIGEKMAESSSNGDERGAKIYLKYAISTRHAITLCYVIGAYATPITSWVLMGADFTINVFETVNDLRCKIRAAIR